MAKSDYWYAVFIHRDHDQFIFRRRYPTYAKAKARLDAKLRRYRREGWAVTKFWEHVQVFLLEREGEEAHVIRIVSREEWRTEWAPILHPRPSADPAYTRQRSPFRWRRKPRRVHA